MLRRPKIKVRWVDHTSCPYLNADVVDVSLATSFFCFSFLFVTIDPWFSMYILIIVDSVCVITILGKYLLLL